ncbi:hypothetical protein PIB30_115675, partial [Stylosanthes scabra]|nr:hypothetical protein [Stylosanthes scabra]
MKLLLEPVETTITTLLPSIFPQNFINPSFGRRHLASATSERSMRSESDSASKELSSSFTSSLSPFTKIDLKTTSLSFSKRSRYSLTVP